MRTILPTMMFLAATTAAATTTLAQTAPAAETRPDDATPPAAVRPMVRIIAPTATAPGVKPVADKYKTELVCKTSIETGSLIAKRKTCLTRKQWAYVNDAHEDEARKLMMDNMGKPTSN